MIGWPRSGGDRGNRSVIAAVGPTLRRVVDAIPLAAPPWTTRIAGCATTSDGSLRVVLGSMVFAIDVDARRVRWSRDLSELVIPPPPDDDPVDDEPGEEPDDEPDDAEPSPSLPQASLPSLLDGDQTMVTMSGTAIILDADGELAERVAVSMVDDSGPAPNTTLNGRPILTTMDGEIYVWHADGLRSIGRRFGYDIVPVAVFADGSFAVSGYAGSGFCRIAADGARIWRSDLSDPDLLPTVNRAQCSAVGSLNEACSAVFDPDGKRLGTYAAAAVFAEYEADGGWIALATDSLARLSPTGEVRWSQPLEKTTTRWGCYQPIVDRDGTIFIVANDRVQAFDGEGTLRASLALGGPPTPLTPVRAGLMATIVGNSLLLIE